VAELDDVLTDLAGCDTSLVLEVAVEPDTEFAP